MRIMVREMSLIRGLGAPAKEMSFPHHLALFKDLSCPLLPTIARHCPRLPAKKMSQSLVASQYGRRSRRPGRVPRAAPRQPGCTAEPTNHEPRSFLARGASRREFRGIHESRNTAFPRPGLRSIEIMVREMSLIRGLGAPAKEMSVRHHLALFKDHSCLLLPTIAR